MSYYPEAMKKKTTAEAYWRGGDALPDDLDDAWVLYPGATYLTEVWDVGCDLVDGKVALYTHKAEPLLVDLFEPIYYT